MGLYNNRIDCLESKSEDPATQTCRNEDWSDLLGKVTHNQRETIRLTAMGYGGKEIAGHLNNSSPRITQIKQGLTARIRKEWGDDILEKVSRPPSWQRDIHGQREKREYRYQMQNSV